MIYDDIIAELNLVRLDKGLPELALRRTTPLQEVGYDSLMFAILITRLEDKLGLDPFQDGDEMVFPQTVGEFVELYETLADREHALEPRRVPWP